MTSKALELRRLMKQQKGGQDKKVTHPLAKYNNIGQLSCVICNTAIKNEIVWLAHLQSKKHKENVSNVKNKPITAPLPPKQVKTSAQTTTNVKPLKSILKKHDDEIHDLGPKQVSGELPADFFDGVNPTNISSKLPEAERKEITLKTIEDSALPPDFFNAKSNSCDKDSDSSTSKSTSDDTRKRKAIANTEELPEGFFDDPKLDAKARKVDYKDPKDVEWEKFQKMIQAETKISEELQDEDDEESEMLKDIAELNNMKSCLSRVENLKKLIRTKAVKGNNKEQTIEDAKETMGSDSSDEEDDIEKMFDWRAKVA